ncbi:MULTISPECIES: hypothetical protein [unclassified Rhizobium]|uniref:hypothetical protein n=1 Tax=Rhizobium sp. VS19-DR181 TaxID=2875957 RepID=UPI001CC3421D|nr:hypothetical protein [Rhizobium sp. VS19-DR181]
MISVEDKRAEKLVDECARDEDTGKRDKAEHKKNAVCLADSSEELKERGDVGVEDIVREDECQRYEQRPANATHRECGQ